MALRAGSRLGPYEIVAALGAGGMGEVYRARDPRLDREVAVKIVRGDAPSEERHRRFEHEARAAGRLNHPNLLTVFDVGVHDGCPYLVTELLEGATLRERLADGAPPLATALAWADAILAGLEAAHARGVVHRDLKPENVFVTASGQVKLLDFGLAKLALTESAVHDPLSPTWTNLTAPGVVVGTCGYMAPEQVRGQPTDARADLFSCGAILYELLTGGAAFRRENPVDSLAAILAEPTPELPKSVSAPLARVVERALAKEPAARFQSARELAAALAAAGGRAARDLDLPASRAVAPPSVAVLAFRELADDPADAGLGLGLADAIITELAAKRSLVVRPTSVTRRVLERGVTAEEAGLELGVDAVLEGRFQRAGNRLRVTMQLIAVASGEPLWATKIDASLDDIFRMQDEVSRHVAAALAGELAPAAEPRTEATLSAAAAGAYELYLRGRGHLARETLGEANLAIDAFEAAVRLDDRFALGWIGLADAYLMVHLEFDPDDAWWRRAEEACGRALALAPDLPEGRYVAGRIVWSARGGWDHARALAECAAAVRARPGLHEAWHRLGTVLCHVSLLEESSACFARAHAINPNDLSSYSVWAYCRYLEGRLDEAVEIAERVWRESPSAWVGYELALCRIQLGQTAEAERLAAIAARQFPGTALFFSIRAILAALAGDATRARREIEQVERHSRAFNHYHHAQYDVATSFAQIGERDSALAWLTAAAGNGFPCADFLRRDPLLEPLRAEPRFTALVAELERGRESYRRLWRGLAVEI